MNVDRPGSGLPLLWHAKPAELGSLTLRWSCPDDRLGRLKLLLLLQCVPGGGRLLYCRLPALSIAPHIPSALRRSIAPQ